MTVTIDLYEQTNIVTVWEVQAAYKWCVEQFGEPGERWTYARKNPDFMGSMRVDSAMEIQVFEFENEEDATFFKLTW